MYSKFRKRKVQKKSTLKTYILKLLEKGCNKCGKAGHFVRECPTDMTKEEGGDEPEEERAEEEHGEEEWSEESAPVSGC